MKISTNKDLFNLEEFLESLGANPYAPGDCKAITKALKAELGGSYVSCHHYEQNGMRFTEVTRMSGDGWVTDTYCWG